MKDVVVIHINSMMSMKGRLGTVDTGIISTLLVQEKKKTLESLETMEEEVAKVAKLEEGVKSESMPGDWGKSLRHTLVSSTDE